MVEVLCICLFAFSATDAHSKGPTPYDDGYFLDADNLGVEETRIATVVTTSTRNKQKFCERTYEGTLDPWIKLADLNEAHPEVVGWDNYEDLRNTYKRQTIEASLYGNNPPGFVNTGMCWFWSRLERAAVYLMRPMPNLPKPSPAERRQIIEKLISMDTVIEVPGYQTVREFFKEDATTDKSLLSAVDLWAVATAPRMLVRVGDRGAPQPKAKRRTRLQYLYERVQYKKEIIFLRFNVNPKVPMGFASHSSLIMDAKPMFEDYLSNGALVPRVIGYQFVARDPNAMSMVKWLKCPFEKNSNYPNSYDERRCDQLERSYDDYDSDMDGIQNAINDYCTS